MKFALQPQKPFNVQFPKVFNWSTRQPGVFFFFSSCLASSTLFPVFVSHILFSTFSSLLCNFTTSIGICDVKREKKTPTIAQPFKYAKNVNKNEVEKSLRENEWKKISVCIYFFSCIDGIDSFLCTVFFFTFLFVFN